MARLPTITIELGEQARELLDRLSRLDDRASIVSYLRQRATSLPPYQFTRRFVERLIEEIEQGEDQS